MEYTILESVAQNPSKFADYIFITLFIALLIYILKMFRDEKKESKAREEKLSAVIQENQKIIVENQKIIGELTEKFEVLDCIKNDIKEIKFTIKK